MKESTRNTILFFVILVGIILGPYLLELYCTNQIHVQFKKYLQVVNERTDDWHEDYLYNPDERFKGAISTYDSGENEEAKILYYYLKALCLEHPYYYDRYDSAVTCKIQYDCMFGYIKEDYSGYYAAEIL